MHYACEKIFFCVARDVVRGSLLFVAGDVLFADSVFNSNIILLALLGAAKE